MKKMGRFYLNVQGTKVKEERIKRTVPFNMSNTFHNFVIDAPVLHNTGAS
jgi:hypothetical protein